MAANKASERGQYLTMAAPAAANAGVGPISGDPLVFGRGTSPAFGLCGVAETSYTPPTGDPTGNISFSMEGVYFLSVVGKDDIGGSNVAIEVGDAVYWSGGTWDPVTNCTYGGTLNKNATSGIYFGNALDAVTSGQTETIRVRLKGNGRG